MLTALKSRGDAQPKVFLPATTGITSNTWRV
jgi:hypothetical protein